MIMQGGISWPVNHAYILGNRAILENRAILGCTVSPKPL